ncbi:MAG: lysylphosphatidylglycerol synthase domain-containing protein [Nitrospinota bacterium]
MKKVKYFALFAGLCLLTVIIILQGIGEVLGVLTRVGGHVFYLFIYFIFPLGSTVLATYILIPKRRRPEPGNQWFGNLLVNSVNWLLPVAQIGGWIARVHWLSRRGMPVTLAGASSFVDLTIQAFAQSLVGILGLILLIFLFWQEKTLIYSGILIAVLLLSAVYVLFKIQKKGLFFYLKKFFKSASFGRELAKYVENFQEIDLEVKALYSNRNRVIISVLFRFLARMLLAGEIFIVFYILGHPINFLDAIFLESLGQTIRAASFLVPGSYGIQEGGYVVLGIMLGLPTGYCLAMALTKRARELFLGGFTLFYWQWREGKSILKFSENKLS